MNIKLSCKIYFSNNQINLILKEKYKFITHSLRHLSINELYNVFKSIQQSFLISISLCNILIIKFENECCNVLYNNYF